jgi:hypothetical protein
MEPKDQITVTVTSPEALVEQLRVLRLQIPEYSQLTVSEAASLRRAATIDRKFMQATIDTVGASLAVQGALGKTPEGLQEEAADMERWTKVEAELRAMLQGVMAANLTRRHRMGVTALQTYSISRQLIRQPENLHLLPHVQEMKRLNRMGRRPKLAPEEAKANPQSPPAPAAGPSKP